VKENGKLPASLAQLHELQDPTMVLVGFDEDGVCRDGWERPFLYLTDGERYTTLSYGRDGRSGGRGLDCDLTNEGLGSPDCFPTLGEFLFDMQTGNMVKACIACGVLAFLTCLVTLRATDLGRAGWVALAVKIGVTMIAATMVATVMSALHIPSGH
jgi:hypothetical protein